MDPTVITVKGMTCGHCVSAVQQEIGALPGVTGVKVDLATGTVRVTAARRRTQRRCGRRWTRPGMRWSADRWRGIMAP